MVIIFEGVDKSGKSSLRNLIRKMRNHADVTIDRFFGSMIVYGKVFDKYTRKEVDGFRESEKKFEKYFKPVLVLVTADVNTISERLKKNNHETIDEEFLYNTSKVYLNYWTHTPYKKKIIVDTSDSTPEDSAREVIGYLERVENKIIK